MASYGVVTVKREKSGFRTYFGSEIIYEERGQEKLTPLEMQEIISAADSLLGILSIYITPP